MKVLKYAPDRLAVMFDAHTQLLHLRNELDRVKAPRAARKIEAVLRSLEASFGAQSSKEYRAALAQAEALKATP